jgi:hypothetical protein
VDDDLDRSKLKISNTDLASGEHNNASYISVGGDFVESNHLLTETHVIVIVCSDMVKLTEETLIYHKEESIIL